MKGYLAVLGAVALSVSGSDALAQTQVRVEKGIAVAGHAGAFAGPAFHFMGVEAGFAGEAVRNAPFSGKQVTEQTQTLADGNKIRHTMSAQYYRDSEGRTRIENTLSMLGPWSSDKPKTSIMIHDPVAGRHYILDADDHTYQKMDVKASEDHLVVMDRPMTAPVADTQQAQETSEDLGTKDIQGLSCKGTRTTTVIAAETVGNEQPIKIMDERWYSSDLQMALETRHSDPRMGEVWTHFETLTRGNPDPNLFQPPADFSEDAMKPGVGVFQKMIRRVPADAPAPVEEEHQE